MTIKFKKRALTAASIAGLAFAATAGAATFSVSTDVENALTVTVVQDMSFGSLFATKAIDNTDTGYSTLVLLPNGQFDDDESLAVTGVPLLSLGGATAARGSITVSGTTPISVTVPDAVATVHAGGTAVAYSAAASTPITLRIGGSAGDPAVARFHLINFTLGDVTGGTAGTPTTNTYPVTPSFGSTVVEFGIGATIVTDTGATALTRNTYEAGTYTGTFEVTASY